MHEDLPDRLVMAAARAREAEAKERGPDDAGPPPSIQPVRSAFESELSALRRAMEQRDVLRPAVGAEGCGGGGFVGLQSVSDASEDDSPGAAFTFHPAPSPAEEDL
jgi:hypothetical protein